MTNEIEDPKKLKLVQVIAWKAVGMTLKNAQKNVGMPNTTYQRALAAYPNIITELILEQYEIELNQLISRKKEILQNLSPEADTSIKTKIEDAQALVKRLASIRAKMKSQQVEVTQPIVDEIPGISDAEIYLEAIRNRDKLDELPTKTAGVESPVSIPRAKIRRVSNSEEHPVPMTAEVHFIDKPVDPPSSNQTGSDPVENQAEG